MTNKIKSALFALVFVAIVSWFSSFASQNLVSAASLKADAVKVEVAVAPPVSAPESATVATPVADAATAAPAAAAASVAPSVLEMVATADVARGKTLAKICMTCHTFDSNGKNGIGPNLHGVVGRKKQSVSGFAYSGKLNSQGGDVWTYVELNKFISAPKAYAAGTKMTYAGMKKPEDRAAVLAFLRSLNNAPAPTAAEIAKESK